MSYKQIRERSLSFQGGSVNVFVVDGSWQLAACLDHPSVAIVGPYIFCPLGTTGFIEAGDVDGDGINDQGSFWSVASLTPAERIHPGRPDLIKIISAPPSGIADLLRGSNGDVASIFTVIDQSVTIWYNVLTPPIDDYWMTRSSMLRPYGPGNSEEQRQYYDLAWGTYQFTMPPLTFPPAVVDEQTPQGYTIEHFVTPDGYPGRGAVPDGWRLVNRNWDDEDFSLHFDPRSFFFFEWTGLDFQNTFLSDTLFFSMRANQWIDLTGRTRATIEVPDLADVAIDMNPLSPTFGQPLLRLDTIVFPPYPFATPDGDRDEFLLGTFDTLYELGPFFFFPGDSATGRLNLSRNAIAGAFTRDVVSRRLEWDVRFDDTYEGFAVLGGLTGEGFPFGTPTRERSPLFDFDGDGVSNLLEFALLSNVSTGILPAPPGQTETPIIQFTGGDAIGACTATITKRPNVGRSIRYYFEYSTDGQSWTEIGQNDPLFQITVDDPSTLTVVNIAQFPSPVCLLRIAVED